MNGILSNRAAEIAWAIVDGLIGLSLATFACFSIVYWGRALVRMANKKDIWTGRVEKSEFAA